jgi:hypothetical protein
VVFKYNLNINFYTSDFHVPSLDICRDISSQILEVVFFLQQKLQWTELERLVAELHVYDKDRGVFPILKRIVTCPKIGGAK